MRTHAVRIFVALLLFWAGIRYIWNDRRTYSDTDIVPIFDPDPLCMFLAWTVMPASVLLMLYASAGYLITLRKSIEGSGGVLRSRMRTNLLLALLVAAWAILGYITWANSLPPYARLSPEHAAAIPVGETATFRVESDLLRMTLHAERAYRPEGKCGSDDTRIEAGDGDRITIEACRPGVGVIRMDDYGLGVAPTYKFDVPATVDDMEFMSSFRHKQGNLVVPLTVWSGREYELWHLPNGGVLEVMDFLVEPQGSLGEGAIVGIGGFEEVRVPIDYYIIDVADADGSRLVRLDFVNARRVTSSAMPDGLLASYDLSAQVARRLFFHWEQCPKPDGWGGDISATFVEKTPDYQPPPPPAC